MENYIKNRKIILYGMSMFKDNVLRTLETVYGNEEAVKRNILFWSDGNEKLWGGAYYGIKIKEPKEILKNPNAIVIICSYKFDAIYDYLRNIGISNEILITPFLVYRTYYDLQYGKKYIYEKRNEIKELYNLEDEYTQRMLEIIFYEREKGTEQFESIEKFRGMSEVNEYFYDDKINPKGEKTWIDVGAYTGDTIELAASRFGDSLAKIYALEPNVHSIEKLKETIKRLNVEEKSEIIACGLGDKEEIISFVEDGPLSTITNEIGTNHISIKTLDSLDLKVIGTAFVKMDIEGAEMSALRGMRGFIEKVKPYLAICLYHRIEDIVEVPNFLKEICGDYTFYLRAGMHTECYAIPKKHLNR